MCVYYVFLSNLFAEISDCEFLSEIKRRVQRKRSRELPLFVNYKTFVSLVQSVVEQFEQPAQKCLDEVCEHVGRLYESVARHSVGHYLGLERKIKVRYGPTGTIF